MWLKIQIYLLQNCITENQFNYTQCQVRQKYLCVATIKLTKLSVFSTFSVCLKYLTMLISMKNVSLNPTVHNLTLEIALLKRELSVNISKHIYSFLKILISSMYTNNCLKI